jgi:hypothetical protein
MRNIHPVIIEKRRQERERKKSPFIPLRIEAPHYEDTRARSEENDSDRGSTEIDFRL